MEQTPENQNPLAGIIGVASGDESVKVEHAVTVDRSVIWNVAAAIAAAMLTIYIVRAVTGE